MRMATALLGTGLCLWSWTALAQDIDNQRFLDLSRKCQAGAAAPASPAAVKIRDVALAQHRSFRGTRVGHTGRMTFFGPSEAESDQENDARVAAEKIPWHQVWSFWEDLQGRKAGNVPHGALEVWFYPDITSHNPPSPVSRKRVQLAALLRAIDQLDFSKFGEDAAHIKMALQQSAIRASISDVAWSAAFIGSVMRNAGVSPSTFSYSSTHIRYVIVAIEQSLSELHGRQQDHFFRACDPELTRPRVGDLLCYHRHIKGTRGPYAAKQGVSLFRSLFRDLIADPSVISRSHCDIVVRVDDAAKKVSVIGGNIQNSVTEKVLNLNQKGVLSSRQGGACPKSGPEKLAGEDANCNLNSQQWFVLLQARL